MLKKSNKLAVFISIGKIVAMILNFIMPVFLSRFLTKEEYGLYSQFYLVHNFVGSICAFGIQSNLYFFFPGTSKEKRRQIVWNTLILISIFSLIGGTSLLIPQITGFLINNDLYQYLDIIILCIIVYVPSLLFEPLGVVGGNNWLIMIYHPVTIVLKIIFVISFALIYHSLDSIFYAILLLESLIFICLLVYVIRYYPLLKGKLLSRELMRKQLLYSLPFGVAVCLNSLCMQIDKIICTGYLSLEDYAIYSVAFFGIPGIMQIYDALCQVNVVDMARYHKENDQMGLMACYKRFVTKTLSFSLPLILAGCLFTPQIIDLVFSDKYHAAIPFFRLYLFTFIFGMIGAGTILRAIGKTKYSMYSFGITTVICIPITYFFIQYYGIWGAITSAMINTILPKLLQVISECRVLNYSLRDYFPWRNICKIVSVSVVFLLPIIILGFFIQWNIITAILISLVYILVTYIVEIKFDVFLVSKSELIEKIKR